MAGLWPRILHAGAAHPLTMAALLLAGSSALAQKKRGTEQQSIACTPDGCDEHKEMVETQPVPGIRAAWEGSRHSVRSLEAFAIAQDNLNSYSVSGAAGREQASGHGGSKTRRPPDRARQ